MLLLFALCFQKQSLTRPKRLLDHWTARLLKHRNFFTLRYRLYALHSLLHALRPMLPSSVIICAPKS